MSETKEIKEVMIGLFKLMQVLIPSFKDGVQAADFAVVLAKIESDPELKAQLVAAYQDVDKIPAEVKSLDFAASADIIIAIFPELVKTIEALKK